MVGGGGREHALACALSESSDIDEVICSPGGGGTAALPKCRNLAADGKDGNHGIVRLARDCRADCVVVGPEAPLARGLIDALRESGVRAFGPSKASARLESSKGFAKEFMMRNGVAAAVSRRFEDPRDALDSLDAFGFPVVVKADGLAGGKGVFICADRREAVNAVEEMMVRSRFGAAGAEIVLEEFLEGWEASIIGITAGGCFMPFPPARDYKRAGEGDAGPNTGGMGVTAPHPLVNRAVGDDIQRNIIDPTMRGLTCEGLAYSGFLFIGVMVTPGGARALEYNVRFGDPEAQALLPLLEGGLDTYIGCALEGEGRLGGCRPGWRGGASCCVVTASGGYPGSVQTGFPIRGIESAEELGCRVYRAGVSLGKDGTPYTAGGRVLGVTALGADPAAARELAYRGVREIDFHGVWYRGDIGAGE